MTTTQQSSQQPAGARGAQRLFAGAAALAAILAALTLPAAGASAAPAPAHAPAARAAAATVTSGTLRAWGNDNDGQVGDGTETNGDAIPVPVKLASGTKVTQVRAGCFFTLALTTTGKVLAWGDNTFGQLGIGTTGGLSTKPVPVHIPPGTTIKAIRAGCRHAIALTGSGKVLAWGYNFQGQLGIGTSGAGTDTNLPVAVHLPAGTTVKSVSAGLYHNLALTTSGKVLAWGLDQFGQLGNGTVDANGIPTPVPATLPTGTTVTGIAATFGNSMFSTSTGQVLVAGDNTFGELGNDSTAASAATPVPVTLPAGTTVKGVFGGSFHILALTSKGKLLAWGLNSRGQLGDGTTTARFHPVRVKLPTGTTVTAITAADRQSFALTSTGTVLAWGFNQDGELGNGMFTDSPALVRVKLAANLAVTAIAAGPGADTADAIVHKKTS
jgi:alpha-tubulin suppressor-like RCC1 family protein